MVRVERRESDWLGIAASAVGGLLAGVTIGVVFGELMGDLHPDRVRGALRRRGKRPEEPEDPRVLQRTVASVLAADVATAGLGVEVKALGDGIVELTGTARSHGEVEAAGAVARGVPGVDVVVNHLLVAGEDVHDASAP